MKKINRWRLYLLALIGCQTSDLYAATCEYVLNSEWNSGFTSSITIHNDSNETISGWAVNWSFDDSSTVSHIWNAVLDGNNPYTASNLGYNQDIAPNASVSFGFNGSKSQIDSPAQIPTLLGICEQGAPQNLPPIAVAQANPVSGAVPFDVTFDASASSDPDGDQISVLWDFGDGTVSSSEVVTRTYNAAGTYSVSLTVNDGALDSIADVVTIVATENNDSVFSLDPDKSSLYFLSTKKTHVVETHTFQSLSGSINSAGEVAFNIDLLSVDTGIDIRNERMRDILFETSTFSTATVNLDVDVNELNTIPVGNSQVLSVLATLTLHGVSSTIDTSVSVTKLSPTTLLVKNSVPILIKAGDFGLEVGIDMLRDIANLDVISYTVPVNFTLFFNAQ